VIIGICGYGYTGSSAVVDLLREYKETDAFIKDLHSSFEFTLPYEPDGLLDLEYNLTKCPAKHLKGDMAIYRFKQLVEWQKNPMNRATNGMFYSLIDTYLNALIQVTYPCRRVNARRGNRLQIYLEKFGCALRSKLERCLKRKAAILKEDTRYICVYPEQFLALTKQLVNDIITATTDHEKPIRIIDQPFPPNNPEQVFHFFDDPYAIVIDRDPRDVYVMVKHLTFNAGRFIPSDHVEDFVMYYRAVRTREKDKDPSRVLRISFERLVYEYEDTVREIENFLHIHDHIAPGKYFNPEISKRNTCMMELFPEDREAIRYIEEHLGEYLFPFENYEKASSRDGIYEMADW